MKRKRIQKYRKIVKLERRITMKKLFAIDVDGTLLTSDHRLTRETNEAIQYVQQQGHVVMICSGRAPESILTLMKEEGIHCPFAASNGTVVYHNGMLLDEINLSNEQVTDVATYLDKYHMPYRLYTSKGIYVPLSWDERVQRIVKLGAIPSDFTKHDDFQRMLEHPPSYQDLHEFHDIKDLLDNVLTIQKFFVLTLEPTKKEKLKMEMERIPLVGVTTSAPFNLEVMHKHGDKGFGIETMANHLGISLKNTVAIGDNYNDIPMFQKAGLSIAMGNADDAIKQLCNVVTSSNNENGVAKALMTYGK